MSQIIRVLIVDDSAYVRKVIREILSRSPFLEVVGAARDGEEALELVEQLSPDVVTLDLNMPRSDGLDFLRKQMARRPLPVVVVSIASESGELVLQALDAGAVDVVQKPTALASDKILEIGEAGCRPRRASRHRPVRNADRHRGDWRLHGRSSGAETHHPAFASEPPGAGGDCSAHASGIH
jgi:two-component system chemotaxis response regulator CheB